MVRGLRLPRALETLVATHVWLGIGAASQAGFAVIYAHHIYGRIRGHTVSSLYYLCFLLTGTVALYGFHRLVGLRRLRETALTPRWRTVAERRAALKRIGIVALIFSGVLFALLPVHWQWRTILPGLLGVLYVLPVYKGWRLRDLGLLKVFVLASGWVGLTFWVPLEAIGSDRSVVAHFPGAAVTLLCLERLAFMLAHSLAFDYRDVRHDLAEGVVTIPGRLGRRGSLLASGGLIVVSVSLSLTMWIWDGSILSPTPYVLVSTLASCPLLVRAYRPLTPDHLFYSFLLDGLFALPGLLLLLVIVIILLLVIPVSLFS